MLKQRKKDGAGCPGRGKVNVCKWDFSKLRHIKERKVGTRDADRSEKLNHVSEVFFTPIEEHVTLEHHAAWAYNFWFCVKSDPKWPFYGRKPVRMAPAGPAIPFSGPIRPN